MTNPRGSRLAAGLLAVAACAVAVPVFAATPEELADYEAKAQFAFFTNDANALRGLARTASALGESDDPLALYHYAHVRFRMLQLAARSGDRAFRREGEAAGEACVEALRRATARNPRFAEGYALQATCHGYLASFGALKAMTNGPRAAARRRDASRIDAGNPRVLLSAAFGLYFAPKGFGGDPGRAADLFRQATEAFERVDDARPGGPSWGAAEAWLFHGRMLEARGDLLGARNAYEKSLIVAPEFAAAHARLAALGTRR